VQVLFRVRDLTSSHGGKPRTGRYPWSHTQLWRMVKRGAFPAGIKASDGTTVWHLDQLLRFEAELQARAKAERAEQEAMRAKRVKRARKAARVSVITRTAKRARAP
jgi:hypothetical protein